MALPDQAWGSADAVHVFGRRQPPAFGAAANAGAVDLTNAYRPDGLRHQRTDSSGSTQVIWDGDDPLAQVDASGNLVQYWSWVPEGRLPVLPVHGSRSPSLTRTPGSRFRHALRHGLGS